MRVREAKEERSDSEEKEEDGVFQGGTGCCKKGALLCSVCLPQSRAGPIVGALVDRCAIKRCRKVTDANGPAPVP